MCLWEVMGRVENNPLLCVQIPTIKNFQQRVSSCSFIPLEDVRMQNRFNDILLLLQTQLQIFEEAFKKYTCEINALICPKISLCPQTHRCFHCDLPPILAQHYWVESLHSQLNQMTLLSLLQPTAHSLKIHTFYRHKLFTYQKCVGLGQETGNNTVHCGWGPVGWNVCKNDQSIGKRTRNIQQVMRKHEDFHVEKHKHQWIHINTLI